MINLCIIGLQLVQIYDYYSVSVNANHVDILTTEATECYSLSKLKEHLTQKVCFGKQK